MEYRLARPPTCAAVRPISGTSYKHTAQYNPDGSATLVIAHRDPGRPNWLETAGHELGAMLFRIVGGRKEIYPAVRIIELG